MNIPEKDIEAYMKKNKVSYEVALVELTEIYNLNYFQAVPDKQGKYMRE